MKHKLLHIGSRPLAVLAAIVMASSTLFPFLSVKLVDAYGQVTTRSIFMQSDAASAATTYAVTFTAATSATVQGIIVDFCSNDPIIGDSCTSPGGTFTVGTPTVTGVSVAGETGGTWTATALNSGRTLELTNSSATGSISTSTASTFNITTMTNPTTVGSFYARILTFDTAADAGSYSPTGANTGLLDAGGVALSTAQEIAVTAKVQEQLNFCIGTTTLPAANTAATAQTSCANLSGNSVTLGNNLGVLSSAGPYVDVSTQYIISTNAQGGAAVVLKGATLTSGSYTIAPIGAASAASASGTSQFGLCTYEGTGSNLVFTNETTTYNNTNCSAAQLTQTAGYNGGTGGAGTAQFAFNTTNTTSATGDALAKENAGGASTGIIAMLGNVSPTQAAGIYTTTLSFIATGTY